MSENQHNIAEAPVIEPPLALDSAARDGDPGAGFHGLGGEGDQPVTTRTAYLEAEYSPLRKETRTYYRNLGRTTLAREGSYDTVEGGILGNESVSPLSDMCEDASFDALYPGVLTKIRLGKGGREWYRQRREAVESNYIYTAKTMLESAASPNVPTHIRGMIQGLQPDLWETSRPPSEGLTFERSVDLIRDYRRTVEAQRLEVMKMVPKWRQEAFQTLKGLGADDTAIKAAEQRLKSSQVHFIAPLEYYNRRQDPSQQNFSYMAGDCSPRSGVIRIVLNKESLIDHESTIKHEYFHAMSAHAPKVFSRGDSGYLGETRIGLRFDVKDRADGKIKEKYAWLNEGITQALTIESAVNPSGSYPAEVELVAALTEHMDIRKLLAVYLEPVDPKLPASQRSPHLKDMVKVFHDTFGPGSLRMIDDYISEHGGLHKGTDEFLKNYKDIISKNPKDLAGYLLAENPHYRKWEGKHGNQEVPAIIHKYYP